MALELNNTIYNIYVVDIDTNPKSENEPLTAGLLIRSILKPDKYRTLSSYDIWKEYNDIKKNQYRQQGIKYNNFLKYIYVLERIQLIIEVKPKQIQHSHPGSQHPSKFTPKEWIKKYYRANANQIDNESWTNPYQEYLKQIGSYKYIESEQAKQRSLEEKQLFKYYTDLQNIYQSLPATMDIKLQNKILRRRTIILNKGTQSSQQDRITIKISTELRKLIDTHRKTKTINGFLFDAIVKYIQ